mmetsp:Transcript_9638/g.22499  ORF Transcript_9638/g.22499 Transcript_9638/m.22499 type:complete len:255 (+) Transcript_9638:1532-2296(+)
MRPRATARTAARPRCRGPAGAPATPAGQAGRAATAARPRSPAQRAGCGAPAAQAVCRWRRGGRRDAGRPASRQLAVHIEPGAGLAHEAADLVQPVRPAAQLAARDELDAAVIGVLHRAALHVETQPLQAGFGRLQRGGPGAGVPGGEQVVALVQHEGGVTGAHQRLGGRSPQALAGGMGLVQQAAALCVGGRAAAGAGQRGGSRRGGHAGTVRRQRATLWLSSPGSALWASSCIGWTERAMPRCPSASSSMPLR